MTEVRKPIASPVSQGRVDFRRLEAAKEARKVQVQKWKEYDDIMSRKEKADMQRKQSDVNFEEKYLLIDAALRNDLTDTIDLLQGGVDPNVAKEDGLTALHQACINGCLDLCKLLVTKGADVDSRDADQWTPLHAASTCGYVDICHFLINANADILATNVDGHMPYDIAEDDDIAELFLQEMEIRKITKADVEAARSIPERQMVEEILTMYNRGEDANSLDEQGAAPIHIAAACNYVDVTNLLLRIGVHPDTPDIESWTPGHIAACWGQLPVLRVLIAHGADLNLTTPGGHTAFTLCESVEIHEQLCEIWDDRYNLQATMRDDGPKSSKINRNRSSIGEKWKFSRTEVMKEVELGLNKVAINQDDPLEDKTSRDQDLPYHRYSPPTSPIEQSNNIIIIPTSNGGSIKNNDYFPDYGDKDGISSTSSSPSPQDGGHVITIVRDKFQKDTYRPGTQWEPEKHYDYENKRSSEPYPDKRNNPPEDPGYQGAQEKRKHPTVTDFRNSSGIGKLQPYVPYDRKDEQVKNPPKPWNDPNAVPDFSRSNDEEPGCLDSYSPCCKNCTIL